MSEKRNMMPKFIVGSVLTAIAWVPLTYTLFFVYGGVEDSDVNVTSPLFYWFVRTIYSVVVFPMQYLAYWDDGNQSSFAIFIEILVNGVFWWCALFMLQNLARRFVSSKSKSVELQ